MAIVSLPRKGSDEGGKVNYTLAGNQMVVGLAEVVVNMSGEQAMSPTTQEVEGSAGGQMVVAGVVAQADGRGGELAENPIERSNAV